ncbi:hypothetical protein [Nocardia sp. Marseille-Q1738]
MSFLEHLSAYDEAYRERYRVKPLVDGPVLVYGRDFHITEDGKVVDTRGWWKRAARALLARL